MTCTKCGCSDSRVVDSRNRTEGVFRRHRCASCGCRFSTMEISADKFNRLRTLAAERLLDVNASEELLSREARELAEMKNIPRANGSHFVPLTPERCIYPGLRTWMNLNEVSVSELISRAGYTPSGVTYRRFADFLRGVHGAKKYTVDDILRATGLTYEQCFGGAKI